jgi:hypothetical protein
VALLGHLHLPVLPQREVAGAAQTTTLIQPDSLVAPAVAQTVVDMFLLQLGQAAQEILQALPRHKGTQEAAVMATHRMQALAAVEQQIPAATQILLTAQHRQIMAATAPLLASLVVLSLMQAAVAVALEGCPLQIQP